MKVSIVLVVAFVITSIAATSALSEQEALLLIIPYGLFAILLAIGFKIFRHS